MRPMLCALLLLACCGVAWTQTNREPAATAPETNAVERAKGGVAWTQTNREPAATAPETNAVEQAKDEPDGPDEHLADNPANDQGWTHIYSDRVQLGIKSRTAIYRGHVRLDDPRIHLTCEQLTASVPESGSRVDHIVAETNVVIVLTDDKGKTNRAYADKAVYTYDATGTKTNETVVLTGHPSPRIEREEGVLYGDVIVWDRIRNQIDATNQRMVYYSDSAGSTNAAPNTPAPGRAGENTAGGRPRTTEATPDE